ncbi:hypothetical protein FGRMN_2751 [Fusarium graminum]|nr:hypothetical protein FGRMN_2751 [Fusarium graminum]
MSFPRLIPIPADADLSSPIIRRLRLIQSDGCIKGPESSQSLSNFDKRACSLRSEVQPPEQLTMRLHGGKYHLPGPSVHENPIGDIMENCPKEVMQHVEFLEHTIKDLRNANKSFEAKLATKLEESVVLRQQICGLQRDIQKGLFERGAMTKEMDKLRSQLAEPIPSMFGNTRRSIIVSKLLSRPQQTDLVRPANKTDVTVYPELDIAKSDSNKLLDTLLSPANARILINSFNDWFGAKYLDSVSLQKCTVCRKLKFEQADDSERLVNEFTTGLPRPITCTNPVCSDCYLESLCRSLENLRESWWEAFGSVVLITCPCGCPASIAIRNRGSLQQILRQTGDRQIAPKLRTYDTIQGLMEALDNIDPRPTLEARKKAKDLHSHLISSGKMKSPFDLRFSDIHAQLKRPFQDANSKLVQMVDIDVAEGTLRVPILTRLLRLQGFPSQCSICTETIRDCCIGSPDEWESVCTEYPECLQQYIESQLDQHGRSGCFLLSCPSIGCGRKLEYNEVKLYALPDTFSK